MEYDVKNVEYVTENIKIKVLLVTDKILTGSINISGFNRFSDFIINSNEDHIKLTDVTLNGKNYPFMLLNKSSILGYFNA